MIAAFDVILARSAGVFIRFPAPASAATKPGRESLGASAEAPRGYRSYDPDLDLLYWGIGNPKPDYDAGVRKGDNLYTNSVVALRGATGELVWHFQFVPADNRDWGANQIPVLVNYPQAGGPGRGCSGRIATATTTCSTGRRARTCSANRLHRRRGRRGWTLKDGRWRCRATPATRGGCCFPGNVGATMVLTDLLPESRPADRSGARTGNGFLPIVLQSAAFDRSRVLHCGARAECKHWRSRLGAPSSSPLWMELHAGSGIDGRGTGIRQRSNHFFRTGSDSGELLWSTETGGTIGASPMAFVGGGEEFVTIAAGGDLLTFGLPKERVEGSAGANVSSAP